MNRELIHIEPGRGRRYPAALRDRVARWTRARRGGGASWQDIAAEVEIAIETIKRWTMIGDAAETPLVLVEVVTDVPRVGDGDREFVQSPRGTSNGGSSPHRHDRDRAGGRMILGTTRAVRAFAYPRPADPEGLRWGCSSW